jgi:hypothetical protein
MRNLLLLFCLLLASSLVIAQKTNDDVKLFIDCNANCDMTFIKTEINYIDFVPDRFISNDYVMITSQETGSGGEEIILYFSGQLQF